MPTRATQFHSCFFFSFLNECLKSRRQLKRFDTKYIASVYMYTSLRNLLMPDANKNFQTRRDIFFLIKILFCDASLVLNMSRQNWLRNSIIFLPVSSGTYTVRRIQLKETFREITDFAAGKKIEIDICAFFILFACNEQRSSWTWNPWGVFHYFLSIGLRVSMHIHLSDVFNLNIHFW